LGRDGLVSLSQMDQLTQERYKGNTMYDMEVGALLRHSLAPRMMVCSNVRQHDWRCAALMSPRTMDGC
jgi:hypothetical protein